MTEVRTINSVMHWIGCTREEAEKVLKSSCVINGAEYSASWMLDKDGFEKLLIRKNGKPVHLLNMM